MLAVELRTTHPEVGVVILSQYAQPLYAVTLLEEGSDRRAYLLKYRVQHRGDLGRAVREVAEGRSVVDPRIVELLLSAKRQRNDSRIDLLTPRYSRFWRWSRRAGATLRSRSTRDHQRVVERHINSIFSKLGLGESEPVVRASKAAWLFLADEAG